MIFDLSREILNTRLGRVSSKGDEKNKHSRDILSVVDIENSLQVLKKSGKRRKGYNFLQPEHSSLPYDEDISAPKYDSHNQLIPPNLQLKRFNNSKRYTSHQNQLIQDLSVKLIAVVLPKPPVPPPRPERRKIFINEDIRVRKLREDKCDLSFCLPKPLAGPRNPSPLRQELACASSL